jgi:hypothetical protein
MPFAAVHQSGFGLRPTRPPCREREMLTYFPGVCLPHLSPVRHDLMQVAIASGHGYDADD